MTIQRIHLSFPCEKVRERSPVTFRQPDQWGVKANVSSAEHMKGGVNPCPLISLLYIPPSRNGIQLLLG